MAKEQKIIVMYGTTWCPDCTRARGFFDKQRVPYHWVDIDRDPEGMAYVIEANGGRRVVPTIVFTDGSILVEPSNAALAAKLSVTGTASV